MKRCMTMLAAGWMMGVGALADTNEIVVTATRERKDVSRVPANVSVITAADIRARGDACVVDALKDLGGVYVRSVGGNPATAEVGMRGFGENSHGRVLVLVDGRRINEPTMASPNWLQIPIGSVERIEVVRGISSALYGNGAVAGVINVMTRQGAAEPEFEVGAEAGSFGMNAERATAAGAAGPLTCSANADRYETDGYRDRSGFLSQGGGATVNYDPNESVSMVMRLSAQEVDFELPGWLSLQQMKDNPRQSLNPDDEADNTYFNADAGVTVDVAKDQVVGLDVSYSLKDQSSDMVSWMSYVDAEINTLAATPTYSIGSDLAGHENNLLVGMDASMDAVQVDRFADEGRGIQTISADITRNIFGAFVRNEFDVTPSVTVVAGGRSEMETLDGAVDAAGAETVNDNVTDHASAMDVSVIRTFDNKSKVFGKVGSTYRYPFIDEQISYFGFGSDAFYTDLEPEKGMSYELGTDVRAAANVRAGITAFLIDMQDEISWDFVAQRNENLDKTRHGGVETYAEVTPVDMLDLGVNYTWTTAEFTGGANDGMDVPLVPEHKISVSARCRLPRGVSVDGVVTHVGEQYLGTDLMNAGPKLGDYVTVDLFAHYRPMAVKGLDVFIGIENLFDEQYASLGYKGWMEDAYYPSPAQTLRGGVSYKF